MPMTLVRATALSILAAVACACGSSSSDVPASSATSPRRLLSTEAAYTGVAWWHDDEIVLDVSSRATSSDPTIQWRTRRDGSHFERMKLPPVTDVCRRVEQYWPQRLRDGALALFRSCDGDSQAQTRNWIVRLKPDGSGWEKLVPATIIDAETGTPLTSPNWGRYGDLYFPDFVVGPDQHSGFAETIGNCGSLVQLTQRGVLPLDVIVGSGDRTWNLREQLLNDPNDGCDRFGTAQAPTSDPDYRRVAFWAYLSVGVGISDRYKQPAEMLTIDPASLKISKLYGGVTSAGSLRWSPTGKWLAFTGAPNDKPFGLWLLNAETKALVLVARDVEITRLD